MAIVLTFILLIMFSLLWGVFNSSYIVFVFNLKSFKTPYYDFGINFNPYQYHDDRGQVFLVHQLNLGFVVGSLRVDFYSYLGTKGDTTVTTISPTV